MIAVTVANMRQGGRGANQYQGAKPPDGAFDQPPISQRQAAELLNVNRRSVQRASIIQRNAVPEIQQMVREGRQGPEPQQILEP
jgi:hypothetical protein